MINSFNDNRALLVKLLGGAGLPEIRGVEDLSAKERVGMTVSACAEVIVRLIAFAANYDSVEAHKGLDMLILDFKKRIDDVCKEGKL